MASGATTIWGRPYPLSTDAPAVHTDIQALATSRETTPLFPTTAVTSRTGVAGESVAVSPSQTLTLPASPVKGDRVQILALGTVTGATPATVAAGGGKVINGLGMSAVSSFLLGTPNSSATVQYDGTAWRVIDGQQDTGWVTISAASWTPLSGTYTPAVRVVADRVQMRGTAQNGTGGSAQFITTLSAAFRPTSEVRPACLATGGATPGFVDVDHLGNFQAFPLITNGSFFGFDDVSYSIV